MRQKREKLEAVGVIGATLVISSLKILYPIHIDRWTSPIATLLREIAVRNPDFDFFSFSQSQKLLRLFTLYSARMLKRATNPAVLQEDLEKAKTFWSLPHIHQASWQNLFLDHFNIVHNAAASRANLAAAKICKRRAPKKCRFVFTANIQPYRQDPFYFEYRQSVQLADVVVAVSHAVAQDVQKCFGRSVDDVIPNGVDIDFFSPQPRTDNYNERPFVLFAAHITQRKRPDIFIQLARMLPQIDFIMVGKPGNFNEQRRYLDPNTVPANVHYLGLVPRSRLRDLMAQALALIFPSEIEGLPLTVIEAGAMGLPVIAQPKSSLPEVVQPGVNGWLFEVDCLDEWAQKIKEIQKWDASLRTSFSSKAREFTRQHYSWNVIARQYADLYSEVA